MRAPLTSTSPRSPGLATIGQLSDGDTRLMLAYLYGRLDELSCPQCGRDQSSVWTDAVRYINTYGSRGTGVRS